MRRDKIRHEFKKRKACLNLCENFVKAFPAYVKLFFIARRKDRNIWNIKKILPMALFSLSRFACFASFIAQSLLLICLEMTGTDLKK